MKNGRKEVEERDGGSNRAREKEEDESGDSPIPGNRLTQKVRVIETRERQRDGRETRVNDRREER